MEVIEECPAEALNEREIYWIAHLNSLVSGGQGYNISIGGNNNGIRVDTKRIIELWQDGKTIPEICEETGYNPITVRKYLKIAEIYSAEEGVKRGQEKMKKARCRAIKQYDLKGKFIAEYESLSVMEQQTGFSRSHIPDCCKGKRKTCYGYQWRYAEDPAPGPTTYWRRRFLDSEVEQWRADYAAGKTMREIYDAYQPKCSFHSLYCILSGMTKYDKIDWERKIDEERINGSSN